MRTKAPAVICSNCWRGAVADEARQAWTCPMCGREITVETVFRALLAAKVGP